MNDWNGLGKSLIGKSVLAVKYDREKVFFLTDQGEIQWKVSGDCCSTSWIENADFQLFGGLVSAVIEDNLPESYYGTHPKSVDEVDGDDYSPGYDYKHYGITIHSAKGTATIDFRNESNGYYGGEMCVVKGGEDD